MLRTSWRRSVREALDRFGRTRPSDTGPSSPRPLRVAVVGIGQVLNGDDGAGVKVARALSRQHRSRQDSASRPAPVSLLVVDAAHAPENCTGAIRRFAPDLAILVDAAEMGDPPGTIRWLDWQDTRGLGASTHALPPYLVARYLTDELSCAVAFIGIQPEKTDLGKPVSPPVQRAVRAVGEGLADLLLPPIGSRSPFRL